MNTSTATPESPWGPTSVATITTTIFPSTYTTDVEGTSTTTLKGLPETIMYPKYELTTITQGGTTDPVRTYITSYPQMTTVTLRGTSATIYTTTYGPSKTTATTTASFSATAIPPTGGTGKGSGLGDFTLPEKMGVGFGISIGGIAVFTLIWFMLRKRRWGAIRLPSPGSQQSSGTKEVKQEFTAESRLVV